MAVVVVHTEDVESPNGVFRPFTDSLGVSGFRVNRLDLPAGQSGPEHDHSANGQEEVYVVVGGSGVLRTEDGEIALRPGHFVFCPPEARRQMVAGEEGLAWIGIGSTT
jgi:quercetin dioxygenase-like cupin family protein